MTFPRNPGPGAGDIRDIPWGEPATRLFLRTSFLVLTVLFSTATSFGCGDSESGGDQTDAAVDAAPPTRAEAIPDDAVKQTPGSDLMPPVLQSDEFEEPVPLEGPINTAGAEDSPFVTADGRDFYIFFTPDVRVPASQQVLDGVSGIWHSSWTGTTWSEPTRVKLGDVLCLDGAEFVHGDVMWFASVRGGNYGEVDVWTARFRDGRWTDIENAGQQLNETYDIGELHLTADGQTMYCGGQGATGRDIFVLHKTANGWSQPQALPETVNSADHNEDLPALSPDESELWFTGDSRQGYPGPSVFRSIKQADGSWGQAEEIVSQFAGEPTIDPEGNVYFVHHYFDAQMNMLEADIYVARKKQ